MNEDEKISADDSRKAFARHLERIDSLFDRKQPSAVDQGCGNQLSELEAAQLIMEADSKMMKGMFMSMPGQASEATIEDLQRAYDIYARVLEYGPTGAQLVDLVRTRHQMGEAQQFMGNASDSMGDGARALTFYRAAREHYDSAGKTEEIARLDSKINQLAEHISGDTDKTIERLSKKAKDDPLEEANRLLDLASATAKGGDHYGALEFLGRVETLLANEGFAEPPPDGLAADLANTLLGLQSGAMTAGNTPIEKAVKIRSIYTSLYSIYAQIYGSADPNGPSYEADMKKADEYQAKWDAMDGSDASSAFSNAMRGFLDRLE